MNDQNYLYFVVNYEINESSNLSQILPSFYARRFFNWMSFLSPEKKLFQIFFPGTIYSPLFFFEKNLNNKDLDPLFFSNHFQNYNLLSQLIAGVRFMDFHITEKEGKLVFIEKTKFFEKKSFFYYSEEDKNDDEIKNKDDIHFIFSNQIDFFFKNFNRYNSEILILNFSFDYINPQKKEKFKEILLGSLRIQQSAIQESEINEKLSYFRSKNLNYLIFWEYDLDEQKQAYFLDSSVFLKKIPFKSRSSFDLTNLESQTDYSENVDKKQTFNLIELKEPKNIYSPFFLEKAHQKYLDEMIENFSDEFHINICSRNFIDINENFILLILKKNMERFLKFNMPNLLLVPVKPEKNGFEMKYSGNNELCIGIKGLKASRQFFKKHLKHNIIFGGFLTTCFTKKEDLFIFDCPQNFLIAYLNIKIFSEEKDNKFNFIIKQGWILEKKLAIKVKSNKNFEFEVEGEMVEVGLEYFNGLA